ncbi:minor capsid protein [Shouchella lehensis]|uniref:Minor capsid protein n=1 Tax=Shouchella lehensis TaxID=300825 RepID=A0A4Y7WI42_9BACI|nr:minor capsid protein [Shouchella lehensis]MBG9785626.1 hypothetical protein [Shouchella lehensis]TES48080.1 minor capsid protein [Shouchella lehensis]
MTHVKITIDTKRVGPKLINATKKARYVVTEQILKDSNHFIPFDQGDLMKSGIRASQLEDGKVIWDMPYARFLYYGVRMNFSKDTNPYAGPLWYERAQSAYGGDWIKVAERAVRAEL